MSGPSLLLSAPSLLLSAFLLTVLTGCYASPPPGKAETVGHHLAQMLSDPHPDVRRTAALSLGKIAHAAAVPHLVTALADSDPFVREYAAWSIGNIGTELPDGASNALVRLLSDPVPPVARAAATALGHMDAGTIPRVLTGLLRSGTVHERRAAVLALGWIETPEAFPALAAALADDDGFVRQAAIAALGELADLRAIPLMIARLHRDPDGGVRSEAAYRLGKLGGREIIADLERARTDGSPHVRRWVQWAIAELTRPVEPESAT